MYISTVTTRYCEMKNKRESRWLDQILFGLIIYRMLLLTHPKVLITYIFSLSLSLSSISLKCVIIFLECANNNILSILFVNDNAIKLCVIINKLTLKKKLFTPSLYIFLKLNQISSPTIRFLSLERDKTSFWKWT